MGTYRAASSEWKSELHQQTRWILLIRKGANVSVRGQLFLIDEITDVKRSQRPRSDTCTRNIDNVLNFISYDRRKSIEDIADIVGLSHVTLHIFSRDDLYMTKVYARRVPCLRHMKCIKVNGEII